MSDKENSEKSDKNSKRNHSCTRCAIEKSILWILVIVVTIMAVEMIHFKGDYESISETVNYIIQLISMGTDASSSGGRSAINPGGMY
jgi:cell division protein FtsL